MLIRPLPFPDPIKLVKLWQRDAGLQPHGVVARGVSRLEAGEPIFRRALALITPGGEHDRQGERMMRLEGSSVSADLFPTLGVQPLIGRTFTEADDRDGAAGTLILSYRLWQTEFGGETGVVGQSVVLDNLPYTIIGVMPQEFRFPTSDAALWTPMRLGEANYQDRGDNWLESVGRLRPGVTVPQARAELEVLAAQMRQQYPKEHANSSASIYRLRDEVSQQSRLLLVALSAASACVLLIACANLANLLLARALARRRELAVRTAMGAGRERLVRQLMTESLMLAFAGGALGVAVAVAAVPLLARLVPATLPIAETPSVDLRVLAFAAVLTAFTGIAFGIAPVLRSGRTRRGRSARRVADREAAGKSASLRAGDRRNRCVDRPARVGRPADACALDDSRHRSGLQSRRCPDAAHGAAAAARRFRRAKRFTTRAVRSPRAARRDEQRLRCLGAVHEQRPDADLRARPRLRRNARTIPDPVRRTGILRDASHPAEARTRHQRIGRAGSPGGRRRERIVRPPLLARPGRHRPSLTSRSGTRDHNVVGDVLFRGLERESEPQVYLPSKQVEDNSIIGYIPKDLAIQSSTPPSALAPSVRAIIRNVDPKQPISDVRTLESIVDLQTASRTAQLRVIGAFAVIAFVLAGIGIHGLLSFAVSQRAQEIGVRMALGAQSSDILSMVVSRSLWLATAGVIPGIALAYGAGRWMQSLLAGVAPADGPTFLAAAVLSVVMTIAGTLVPTIRALRVNPITAIRTE